jgi:hypothetical protein
MEWWEHFWGLVETLAATQDKQLTLNKALVELVGALSQRIVSLNSEDDQVVDRIKDLAGGLEKMLQIESLTENTVNRGRQVTVARWKVEALDMTKDKLSPGEAVCTRCHFVAGGPSFFNNSEKPDEPICPNCKTPNTAFLKSTEVVSTVSVSADSQLKPEESNDIRSEQAPEG